MVAYATQRSQSVRDRASDAAVEELKEVEQHHATTPFRAGLCSLNLKRILPKVETGTDRMEIR